VILKPNPPYTGRLVLTWWLTLLVMSFRLFSQEPAERPAAKSPTFEVRAYAIAGNSLLTTNEIATVTQPYTGTAVGFDQIRQALAALVSEYRRRGYVTVGVTLPPQQLTNGIVQVQATEGRLVEVTVVGNEHYSEDNIRRALPSLGTNVLLNTRWFQPELDQANGNSDRQIYPVIGPGPEPGTSSLTLKVKDRLPLHGRIEVDNRATPGTPPLRVDSAIQYNNLWQRDHQAGIQYNFTPQELKESGVPAHHFFDQPRVASYSAFYRLPLGTGEGAREDFEQRPSSFGYDPVSRTFRAPPLTGNPDLIVYASRSASETRVRLGDLKVITTNASFDIRSQPADRDLIWNENVGTRYTLPLEEFSGIRSSLAFGADYKTYRAFNFSTNLTYLKVYGTNSFGERELQSSDVIPIDSNSGNYLFYVPLTVAWSASRQDARGFSFLSLNTSTFLSALSSGDAKVRRVAGSTNAGGNFVTVSLSFVREQKLPHDWTLSLRANGQWASTKVINNEQFGLGGTAGVRGYEEGEEYGDAGWRVLVEPKAPAISIGQINTERGSIPITLRGTVYLDYGERYLFEAPATVKGDVRMLGTGVSGLVNAGDHVELRLGLAWALLDTPSSRAGTARAYFSFGIQF
jgi:hemolysin activation/secretion protein